MRASAAGSRASGIGSVNPVHVADMVKFGLLAQDTDQCQHFGYWAVTVSTFEFVSAGAGINSVGD